MALTTPSMTLYVSGLETKTKKPELRSQLYSLFTPYGRVIDIIAKKHDGGRGQAFITFEEQSSATAAMRGLSGELFYNKELRITYSKKPSNATLSRLNPEASREAALIKAAQITRSNAQGEYEQLEKERLEEEEKLDGSKRVLEDGDDDVEGGGGVRKKVKVDGSGNAEAEEVEMEMEMEDDDEEEKKEGSGSSLICSNLPAECNEQIMSALYSQYPGFSSARPLPSSKSIPSSHPPRNPGSKSFVVTFNTAENAKAAMGETKGYLMQPGWEMGVSIE